jgi:hypothetical protein
MHVHSIHGDDLTLHCMAPSEQSAAALGQHPHSMPQRVSERGAAALAQHPPVTDTLHRGRHPRGRAAEPNKALRNTMSRTNDAVIACRWATVRRRRVAPCAVIPAFQRSCCMETNDAK